MKPFTIIFLLAINILAFSGANCSAKGRPAGTFWEPLPAGLISDIQNLDPDLELKIRFNDYESSNPEANLTMWLQYDRVSGKVVALGDRRDFSAQYAYTFTSTQGFIDLVDYILAHQDVFFNYEEFNPSRPGWVFPPEDANESFQLMLLNYSIAHVYHDYCIFKSISPSNPVPEIQYVIDTLKTQFKDVLLQHPFELPPEPGPNPPWQFHGGGD